MFSFLHNFAPSAVLIALGPIKIYWYGLFVVLAITAAIIITIALGKKQGIKSETIIDLGFWLVIAGLVGARLYDVFLEIPYYLQHPEQMVKIWEGGLAIHGAIIAGLLTVWIFARKYKLGFWQLAALVVPGLAIGQAIGRWGNYFNQELFGLPTEAAWGIPINIINRPLEYLNYHYFHPTFLYESIGCLLIGSVLIWGQHRIATTRNTNTNIRIVAGYLIAYSLLRFTLEFIKIDKTPVVLNLRWPQLISLAIIIISVGLIIYTKYKTHDSKKQ